MDNMQPIRNYVLTKPFPSDEISAGGIIVSEAHRAISNKMKVVAVGNGVKDKPMQFKEGDVVFRVRDDGEPIDINGERHYLILQTDLLAKSN
jgi:chaperonin GroES